MNVAESFLVIMVFLTCMLFLIPVIGLEEDSVYCDCNCHCQKECVVNESI